MTEKKAYLAMLLSIIPLWQAIVSITRAPPFLLPPPAMVGAVMLEEWRQFVYHTSVTVAEAFTGYFLANLIALTLAISFLYVDWLEAFLTPWTVIVNKMPFLAVAAMLIIIFGGDSLVPVLLLIVVISFFPLLVNVSKGLKEVDSTLVDRMKVLDASHWQIFRYVRWPHALPYYLAGHEAVFTGSIVAAMFVEYLFGRRGLGFVLVRSFSQYRADKVYAVAIISLTLAILFYMGVRLCGDYLMRWRKT